MIHAGGEVHQQHAYRKEGRTEGHLPTPAIAEPDDDPSYTGDECKPYGVCDSAEAFAFSLSLPHVFIVSLERSILQILQQECLEVGKFLGHWQ